MSRYKPVYERFMAMAFPEPMSGCWLWTGARDKDGYGRFWDGVHIAKAHHASWALHRGTRSRDSWVLHRCDNPCCVNPDHLFLGNHAINMRQMVRRGRNHFFVRKGSYSGAKITIGQVIEIRCRATKGELQKVIALDFGLSKSSVSQIVNRKTWPHVKEAA